MILAYLKARELEQWHWGRSPAGYHWGHFHAFAEALVVPLAADLGLPEWPRKPFDALMTAALRDLQPCEGGPSEHLGRRSFPLRQFEASASAWIEAKTPFSGYIEGSPFPDFVDHYDRITGAHAAYRDTLVHYMTRLVELLYGPRHPIPATYLGEWGRYDPAYRGDIAP